MNIETWPIEKPIDYPKNARKWSPRAVDKVAASIGAYGWRQPIVVDKAGVIVIGHLRRLAGRTLGLTTCPVHVAADLTAAQIRGLRLADNRTNQESDWDLELLGPELLELKAEGFDLTLTGFDSREIDGFTLKGNAAEDEVLDVPEVPVSRLGDLWLCGPHRVLCGDATNQSDVTILLAGVPQPFLMVTDPPYGVEYDPEWRGPVVQKGKVANDGLVDWSAAWGLFSGDVAYIWNASLHLDKTIAHLRLQDFEPRALIIWKKQAPQMSRGAYHWQHESCWYVVRHGKSAHWSGDRHQSTIWDIPNLHPNGNSGEEKTGHGTQKPIELMRRPILNHTQTGQAVYDPFLGSGTTLAAAELTERMCYGLELDPKYVDMIIQRWQNLSKQTAILQTTGRSFSHEAAERLGETHRNRIQANG